MPVSRTRRGASSALALLALSACATQPAYRAAPIAAPPGWTNAPGTSGATIVDTDHWWNKLGDPAIDALVAAALRDNPTLAEAGARVDAARAMLAARGAPQLPNVGLVGNAGRARDGAGGATPMTQTNASLGASLAWEIDLWGRVRAGRTAARNRLAARTADADAARLSVSGEIADTAVALRACHMTLAIRDEDIASREIERRISRARLSLGSIAPVTLASAESNLASARTARILQAETCQRLRDSLVAVSGLSADAVAALLPTPPSLGTATDGGPLPVPPPFVPALPATVLLSHPAIVAAEREVAARWSEIAIARAERLPRLDLAALLTGQWIRALGASSTFASNSASIGLAGPLFDGGAGAANVRGAEAAYREALAQLQLAIRNAVRDIEDALAAQRSAIDRVDTTGLALDAARFTLRANEARWRAGAIAQYELEETRRQFRGAQESAVTAAADRARAWIALVRRTGPTSAASSIVSPTSGSAG